MHNPAEGSGGGLPRVGRTRLHRGVKFDMEMLEYAGRDGVPVRREFLRHPGSVIVLPILDDGHLAMIRSFRASLEREIWELPAGTRSPGEDPAACAARELEEETGFRAERLEPLASFWTAPGLTDERMHAFVARGLHQTSQRPELDEFIRVEPLPVSHALSMVDRGEIADAKTMLVMLWAVRAGVLRA